MIIAALRGRFGALSPEVERAPEGADMATLQPLLPHAGTDSLDELRARLGV